MKTARNTIERRTTPASRRRGGQGGHVMLEMGLCMVVLFFMIFGIVEYSNVNFANNFCAYAAQQAARYASVRGSGNTAEALPTSPSPCGTSCTNASSNDPTTAYVQGLAVGLNPSNLTVTTTWSSASGNANTSGGTVTVKVSYTYSPILAAVTKLPTPFSLNSSSTYTVIQ